MKNFNKQTFIKIFAVLSFILPLAATGNAQINKNAVFEVPYEFVVGDKVLPAGEYTLRSANDQNSAWLLAGTSVGKAPVFVLAGSVGDSRTKDAKLTFRQYGNRYFLAEFTVFDYRITLSKTREERTLRQEFSVRNRPVRTDIVMNKIVLTAR